MSLSNFNRQKLRKINKLENSKGKWYNPKYQKPCCCNCINNNCKNAGNFNLQKHICQKWTGKI